MSMVIEGGSWVFPGDRLAGKDEALAGKGTYLDDSTGVIRALLHGLVMIEEMSSEGKKISAHGIKVNVLVDGESSSKLVARDLVPRVGDVVLARILRTNYNQAYVDIFSLGDHPLAAPIKAVIRREDIRELEVDKVVVQEFFKPFDVVRAVVISLGDSKYYFLSTANKTGSSESLPVLGVVLPQPRSTEI